MDSGECKEDYRQYIIPKWVGGDIESFQKPSLQDLENQSREYKVIIEKIFPLQKGIEILEIGCGWGGLIYALKKYGFKNIDAIDIIPECCVFVSQEFGINVTCINALDFFKKNNKKYDVIAAFDVIEHFNKNEIAISLMPSIFESLKKSGLFIMRVPNGGSPLGLYIRYSGFTHELAFTPLSINELFKAIGFQEVCCIPEPELKANSIKGLLKRLVRKFSARLLSLDPSFINSANIIGVGFK
jgi:2-polyprenyl-3-methyl-5-hydroxy-6-metoxy-1,4-benzoquinol methylase